MTDKQQLDAELTAILPYLPGWQLDPKYAQQTWCAVLRDGTGKGIHVNATQAKGRLCISGIWPSDSTHQQCTPDKPLHISVARNRPPEKIAADLQRRFLPWYTAAYAAQTEQTARRNDRRTRQQEVTVELAALLGDDATRRAMRPESSLCSRRNGGRTQRRGNGQHPTALQEHQSRQSRVAGARENGRFDGLAFDIHQSCAIVE